MTFPRKYILLTVPALGFFLVFLMAPLATLLVESLRIYTPGRVGSVEGTGFTVENYSELFSFTYASFFLDTFRISLIATTIALVIGFSIAYRLARMPSGPRRTTILAFLVLVLFISTLIRVYAVALTFGPTGLLPVVARALSLNPNGGLVIEALVVFGLLQYLTPITVLTLIGTIQNINPRFVEAATALGASRVVAHATITLPLSIRGVISAGLINYTLCIGAFAIPMILGRGRLQFVSNLIYARFSQVSNFPSGAAISMVILILSIVLIYLINRRSNPAWELGR